MSLAWACCTVHVFTSKHKLFTHASPSVVSSGKFLICMWSWVFLALCVPFHTQWATRMVHSKLDQTRPGEQGTRKLGQRLYKLRGTRFSIFCEKKGLRGSCTISSWYRRVGVVAHTWRLAAENNIGRCAETWGSLLATCRKFRQNTKTKRGWFFNFEDNAKNNFYRCMSLYTPVCRGINVYIFFPVLFELLFDFFRWPFLSSRQMSASAVVCVVSCFCYVH